ncbi:MAG: hypothetical protein QOD99_2031 [Chthoniobacter sp.]|jgi:flagellar biosynthesis chaperone FliJ|nr:hypothetical protein [Chthoniobacter sp.]
MLIFSIIAACLAMAGCTPKKQDESNEAAQLELARVRTSLTAAQTNLRMKQDEFELLKADAESKQSQPDASSKQLAERDARIATLEAELDKVKKQDSQVFKGIGELRQRGNLNSAMNLYRMFMQDFPDSPLVPDAQRAITALTETVETTVSETTRLSPNASQKRKELDLKKRLPFGAVTVQELSPFVKHKTSAEITGLLGNPDHVFPSGSEWGYADRAIDDQSGQRGMLIVTFTSGRVSSFRVGYAGREIVP